jgi:hypothetical protein
MLATWSPPHSFQLLRHGGRWWIVSVVWDFETPETPIPEDFLAGDGTSPKA